MKRLIIYLAAPLLPIFLVIAEDEPDRCLAGESCPRETTEPYPETGAWFNPDEPGSGFVFEVQNAKLAGYYFGYNTDGTPLWYLFSGLLELDTTGPATWELEAELERFQGGSCIDCSFIPPNDPVVDGSIRLEFFSRTQARFSIDDGMQRRIQSFTFGTGAFEIFPGIDYRVPDLQGQWLIVIYDRETEIESFQRQHAAVGSDVWLELGTLEPGRAFFGIFDFQRPPEVVQIGNIECVTQRNGTGGRCTVSIAQPPQSPKKYFMPVTNISDTYFSATAPDGDTIEGFRVNYD